MQESVLQLSQQVAERRYGKFRGFVEDNEDPEERGRIKVRVPSVLGDGVTDWALPCTPFGGARAHGFFAVPEVNAQVWVEFEEGDIHRPIWVGTFWQHRDDVPEGARKPEPTTRSFETPSGHVLQFEDEEGAERLLLRHATEAELEIDAHGTVTITDADGATIRLDTQTGTITIEDTNGNVLTMSNTGTNVDDSNGNSIEMSASGIVARSTHVVIDAQQVDLGGLGGEPLIKGLSFLAKYATHTHFVTPIVAGQSSPPIPQGEISTLSTGVRTT